MLRQIPKLLGSTSVEKDLGVIVDLKLAGVD